MKMYQDKRGSVSLVAGLMANAMVMMMAMAIELTYWSVNHVELQRIADASAFAAATNYMNASSPSKTTASAAGQNVAVLNGIALANVSVTPVTGVKVSTDQAFQATVSLAINKTFSAIFSTALAPLPPTETISATAIAEIVTLPPNTPQPCVLALAPSSGTVGGNGYKYGITMEGGSSITATSCSVVSNAAISFGNNSTISVNGTYSGTDIWDPAYTANNATYPITGGFYHPSTLSDPYANNNAIQTALDNIPASNSSYSWYANGNNTPQSITPGNYSSITVSGGVVNMSPGTYYVNGTVTFENSATVNGTGVTIIASGALKLLGGSAMNVTAPGADATQGIPGLVFASNLSTDYIELDNNTIVPTKGLIYYPKGQIVMAGGEPPSNGCVQYIANTFDISNGVAMKFYSSCTGFGLPGYGSTPDPQGVALVQ